MIVLSHETIEKNHNKKVSNTVFSTITIPLTDNDIKFSKSVHNISEILNLCLLQKSTEKSEIIR